MKREEQIKQAAKEYVKGEPEGEQKIIAVVGFEFGAEWADSHPFGVLDEDYVWNIYNFVNKWKSGGFGETPFQKALENFGKEVEL